MNAAPLFVRMAQNNAWANHRLYKACEALSDAELHAKRTGFFPTLMKTLNHNLIVDWYYVDALEQEGRGLRVFISEEPFAELAPLSVAQHSVDQRLIAVVSAIKDDSALDARVNLERRDHTQVERVADVLLHLLQHQIHHRGQVHAMLSGTSVKPPQLDEFFLREELPLRRAELIEMGLPLV